MIHLRYTSGYAHHSTVESCLESMVKGQSLPRSVPVEISSIDNPNSPDFPCLEIVLRTPTVPENVLEAIDQAVLHAIQITKASGYVPGEKPHKTHHRDCHLEIKSHLETLRTTEEKAVAHKCNERLKKLLPDGDPLHEERHKLFSAFEPKEEEVKP